MNRFFKAAVCLLLLAACTTVQVIRPKVPDMAKHVSQMVEVGHEGRAFSTGSAVPIAPGVFLTARHVVELPEYLPVEGREVDVAGYRVTAIQYLGDRDAALLFVDVVEELPLPRVWPVDAREPLMGEVIWVSGFGLGEFWLTQGLTTEDPERLSVTVAPGDSGCPYFDAYGAVRGIIVARDRRAAHHTFTEPMSLLVPLIPEAVRERMFLVEPIK